MSIPVYNLEKKEVGTIEVPDRVFGTEWNPDLVHQAVVTQDANTRSPIAHTKDRSEVRGGGKKPWRQKGTGRARHGSNRSPLWSGGGVTFGPTSERVFTKKINKKMKLTALFSALSRRFSDGDVLVVDGFSADISTTKAFGNATKALLEPRMSVAFVFSSQTKELERAARNLQKHDTVAPISLNVKDVLKPGRIIFDKNALEEMVAHYIKA